MPVKPALTKPAWDTQGDSVSKKRKRKLGVVSHTCSSSYSGGRGRKITSLRQARESFESLSQNQNKNKRVEVIVQVVGCLSGMCKALDSILQAPQKNTVLARFGGTSL
jgi:predicted metal-binding protein